MNSLNSVYVVDRDLSARRGITRLLHTAGYDVRGFSSLGEFCEALGHEMPGCAVLDAGLLEEVANELQTVVGKACENMPIIVVSAYDDRQTRQRALRLNAIGFFRKPVDGTALLDAIDWVLQQGRKEDKYESS